MKSARTILIFTLIISIILVIGCEKIEKNEEEYGLDKNNPLLFTILSKQGEYDANNDICIKVAYGWANESVPCGDEDINMLFTINNYVYGECDSLYYRKRYFVELIKDFFTEKYQITQDSSMLNFSHSEELVLPKELFIGNSGSISFNIQDDKSKFKYSIFYEIEYIKQDGLIKISESKAKKNKTNDFDCYASEPTISINKYYEDIGFNWDPFLYGYDPNESKNINIRLIKSRDELKQYCVGNSISQAVDIDGNFKETNIGKRFNQYDSSFFSHKLLLIIPTYTTLTAYSWPISHVYLNNNKVYVVKYEQDNTPVEDEMPILYVLEISKTELDDSAIEIENFFSQSSWYEFISL